MLFQIPIDRGPAESGPADGTESPFFLELEPSAARRVVDEIMNAPFDKLSIDEERFTVSDPVGYEHARVSQFC